MLIRFGFEITVNCAAPVPVLLALSCHPDFRGRLIGEDHVRVGADSSTSEYRDHYDNRFTRLVLRPGETTLWSDCIADIDGRADSIVPDAIQHPVEELPVDVLAFLIASRYCESDMFGEFAWRTFGNTAANWHRVQAICDFVHEATTFGYKFGRPTKTAQHVFTERTGVCRDFAHLAVALCRAMNIPARYASGYLGDIDWPDSGPGDFCAWFEAYLGGQWHVFDARYNAPRIGRIPMVRGLDAADVAMITSFGSYDLTGFRVWTAQIDGKTSDAECLRLLAQRPAGEALIAPSSGRLGLGES